MEYFMFLATDAEEAHEARLKARPAHLERLEQLRAEGRLLTAGPNPLPDNPERVFRQPDYRPILLTRRSPTMGGTRPLC